MVFEHCHFPPMARMLHLAFVWLVLDDYSHRSQQVHATVTSDGKRCSHARAGYTPSIHQNRKGHCVCLQSTMCVGSICGIAEEQTKASNNSLQGFAMLCDECMCASEETVHAQWAQPHSAEQFVTFRWNGGRMGNQMMSVNYAFQVAHALDRTVYIRCQQSGANNKVGLQPDNGGFWDVEHLAKKFSVAFDASCGILQSSAAAGVKVVSASTHPVLSNPNRYCTEKLFFHRILNGKSLDDCFVLDLEGAHSVKWQSKVGFHEPLVFWQALRPVKLIRDFVQAKFDSYLMFKPSFAIHHRNTLNERRFSPKYINSGPIDMIAACSEFITSEGRKFEWNAGPPEEDGWMCSLTVPQIEKILTRGGIDVKLEAHSKQRWWLLDDFSLCDPSGDCPHLQNDLFAHGALLACSHPQSRWSCVKEQLYHPMKLHANSNYTAVDIYLSPVIDQWIGVSVDFHIGLVGSTFDEAICGMRGENKLAMSNICSGWNRMRQAKSIKFI
eukprot:m.4056 g.4056  ORF g.4056 m.4056 type:complete len:497 (+) comp3027_c0_seq1:398-1888(+)